MKFLLLSIIGAAGGYWLLSSIRHNYEASVGSPDLSSEDERGFWQRLRDILGKTTLPLTQAQMKDSIRLEFPHHAVSDILAYVAFFVKQWDGWLVKTRLANGDIGYRWR